MSVKGKPKVSVIIPTYNDEKYIVECINSILNQTYKNIEIILVDDASDDKTVELIKTFEDPRIKLLKNDRNRGISYTTNRGISFSSGDYIALMDDDDISELKRLELQVDFMEANEDIDILGGRCRFIDDKGKILFEGDVPRNNPNYIKAVLLFNNLDFVNSTVMVRRDFLKRSGLSYEENCYGMQDYLFFIKCSKVGNISSIKDFIVRYRIHDNNRSDYEKNKNKDLRAEKYSALRVYSIQENGFELSSQEYGLLNATLMEGNEHVKNYNEWLAVARILNKMINQSREEEMNIEEELAIVSKKMLLRMMKSFDFINDESFIALINQDD